VYNSFMIIGNKCFQYKNIFNTSVK
jgi:hypothetical protein